jgi:hypothetical protein
MNYSKEVKTVEDFKQWAAGRDIKQITELNGFKLGQQVTFTNENGVVFTPLTIIGIDQSAEFYERQFYLNTDCYWFPKKLSEIKALK